MKFIIGSGMANTIAPTSAISTDTSMMAATQTVTETVTDTVTETIQKVLETAISGSISRDRHLHRRMPSIPARVLTAIAPGYSRVLGHWGQDNPILARFIVASSGILAGTKLYKLSRAMYVRGRKYTRERKRLRRERQVRQGTLGNQKPNQTLGGTRDGETNVVEGENWEAQSQVDPGVQKKNCKGESIDMKGKDAQSKGVKGGAMAKFHLQPALKDSHGLNDSSLLAPPSKELNISRDKSGLPASELLPTSQAPMPTPHTYEGGFASRTHEILALTKQVAELGKRFKEREIAAKDYSQQSEPLRKRLALLREQDKQAKEALKSSSAKAPGPVVPTTKRKLSPDTKNTEEESERAKAPRSSAPENGTELDLNEKPLLRSSVPANPSDNPPHLPPPDGAHRAQNTVPSEPDHESKSPLVANPEVNQTVTSTPLESEDKELKPPGTPSKAERTEAHSQKSEDTNVPSGGRRSERSTRYKNTMNVNTLSRRSASPGNAAPEPSGRLPPKKNGKRGPKKKAK